MRIVFIFSFLANIALALASLIILPERVAIHFSTGGMPDGWASGAVNTLALIGLDLLMFVSFYFSPRLMLAVPPKWVSLPNRDFWLSPENRKNAAEKMSAFMYQFGAVMFIFLFLVGLMTIQANLSDPIRLNEKPLYVAMVMFLGYTVVWCVMLIRSFRVPEKRNGT